MNKFDRLHQVIKNRVPEFKIKYKDESYLMKFFGKVLFFNKNFMETVTTTIGKTVYFPNKKFLEERYFSTLAHEYVHVLDYVRKPLLFSLSYLFPQILSLFSLLAFVNIWFLLFLIFLLPFPAKFRTNSEIRGYGMSIFVKNKLNIPFSVQSYVDIFSSPKYYYMCRNKSYVERRLKEYLTDDCLSDKTPAYVEVNSVINENI